MSVRTKQGDYMFLARDREALALRKLAQMPWAEDRHPSDGRSYAGVVVVVAVALVAMASGWSVWS